MLNHFRQIRRTASRYRFGYISARQPLEGRCRRLYRLLEFTPGAVTRCIECLIIGRFINLTVDIFSRCNLTRIGFSQLAFAASRSASLTSCIFQSPPEWR
ncbi:hypothetical protein AVJ24_20335 [Yersinia pestis]|nr:hypothetical protein AVJ24_20335 [Yersinia pestis]